MSAEGRIRTAFESAPYMVRYAGLWLPPDERGDRLTGWEDSSDAADDAELLCFEDGYEPNAHEIMVSTPDELRGLLRAARSVQDLDPDEDAAAIEDTVEHESDHIFYAEEVLGAKGWRFGLKIFRFPPEYLKRHDLEPGQIMLDYMAFVVGKLIGPKAGVAGVFGYPLVPSDGDEDCYQALGYPTITDLGDAVAGLGFPMPRSLTDKTLGFDDSPSGAGEVIAVRITDLDLTPETPNIDPTSTLEHLTSTLGESE